MGAVNVLIFKFNALAYIKDKLFVFDEVCHSCGGCVLLCPEKALAEKDKAIGKVQRYVGRSEGQHRNTKYR